MQIDIFNVNHGQAALITAPNGARALIDCGDRTEGDRWWAPSLEFAGQLINLLVVTNLDEDHLSNFDLLNRFVTIGGILSNPTVGALQLALLKTGGLGVGTSAFARWLGMPKSTAPFPDFGGLQFKWYYNCWPFGAGTNDLSMVLFVSWGNFTICFTGDMERTGWLNLLRGRPELANDLARTNVFVASHHGRESGCSADIFDHFKPEIVIISDAAKQYQTQDTDGWYRARCRGIRVENNFFARRYVFTTRSDGSMRIKVGPFGWRIDTVADRYWLQQPVLPRLDDPFSGNDLLRALGYG